MILTGFSSAMLEKEQMHSGTIADLLYAAPE
jgi:hypothetical protein